MPIDVLMIGHSLHSMWYGGETRVAYAVLNALKTQNCEVKTIALPPTVINWRRRLSTFSIDPCIYYYEKLIRRWKPYTVMLWYDATLDSAIYILKLAERYSFRLIYSVHFHHLWCPRGTFECLYETTLSCNSCTKPETTLIKQVYDSLYAKKFLKRLQLLQQLLCTTTADYVFIVPSKFMAKLVKTILKVQETRIKVIYNGIDINVFRPLMPKEDRPTILYVGAMVRHKGFHHYLLIAKLLKQKYVNLQVWAVGEGPLKSMAEKYCDKVFSNISDKELAKLYSRAWVVIAPSLWPEPFHLVTLESIACRTPVVAYAVGGICELAKYVGAVYLCRRGDISCLKNVVERLIDNSDDSTKRLAHSVQEKFSLQKMLKEYLKVILV